MIFPTQPSVKRIVFAMNNGYISMTAYNRKHIAVHESNNNIWTNVSYYVFGMHKISPINCFVS